MHMRFLATLVSLALLLPLFPGCGKNHAAEGSRDGGTAPASAETDYRKLASPALYPQFIGKTLTVRAVYLSEWTDITTYKAVGIRTDNRLFLNHRAPGYRAASNGLGSSDAEFPPFVMSADVALADAILKLRHGDEIVVTGKLVPVSHPIDAARCVLELSAIDR